MDELNGIFAEGEQPSWTDGQWKESIRQLGKMRSDFMEAGFTYDEAMSFVSYAWQQTVSTSLMASMLAGGAGA